MNKFIQVIHASNAISGHVVLRVGAERPKELVVAVERNSNTEVVGLTKLEAIELRERLVEAINALED